MPGTPDRGRWKPRATEPSGAPHSRRDPGARDPFSPPQAAPAARGWSSPLKVDRDGGRKSLQLWHLPLRSALPDEGSGSLEPWGRGVVFVIFPEEFRVHCFLTVVKPPIPPHTEGKGKR
jgi:hypothetical protein